MECKICKKEIEEELCLSCREFKQWKESDESSKITEEEWDDIDSE